MTAGTVGTFPGLALSRRMVIRAPQNPLDKSTVFSIIPKHIHEVKITIQPSDFILEPGSAEKPSRLVVGSSSWFRDIDENQPILEIPVYSTNIAASIVSDYCQGILGCDMGNSMPGLFWVPGDISVEVMKKDHAGLLADAIRKRRNLNETLVRMADSLWARANGNPLVISDDMRIAAKELNLEHIKEWTKEKITLDLVRCVACGNLRNPSYPICSFCKAVADPQKAKELNLTFAQ